MPKNLGIGTMLTGMVAVAVMPIVIATGLLIVRDGEQRRDSVREDLARNASLVAAAIDSHLARQRSILETLARSNLLDRGDFRTFHGYLKAAIAAEGAVSASLFAPDGAQVLNTLRAPGAPVPTPFRPSPDLPTQMHGLPVGDALTMKRVFSTGRPTQSDVYWGIVAQRALFTVDVPVVRDGKVVYGLNAGYSPESVIRLLGRFNTANARVGVYDGQGRLVARTLDGTKSTGSQSSGSQVFRAAGSGIATTRLQEKGEEELLTAWHKTASGWIATVSRPQAQLKRAIRQDLLLAGGLSAVSLFIGLLVALQLAGRIRAEIRSVSKGDIAPSQGYVVRELGDLRRRLDAAAQDRDARVAAEARHLEAEQRTREKDELIEALSAARRQLEEADERKDLYLATLAHELRNPLAPIRNSIALLRKRTLADPTTDWAYDVLERQSAQMTRLLDDLLDVSRIARGKVKLRSIVMPVSRAVFDAVQAARAYPEAAQIEVHTAGLDDALMVRGDPIRLAQVFQNLLINAARYAGKGGRVDVEVSRRGDEVHVRVRDSGIGIDPSFLPRLFEPFSQGPDQQGRQHGGLGLGLALVKGLVELHGGRVSAESEGPGTGATFTVSLPVVQEASERRAREADLEPLPTGTRVLVVDDNRDAADSLARLLEQAGAEVRVAYDAYTALAAAKEWGPSVAVTDISMPGRSGYELAKDLSSFKPGIVLVALTGWGQQADQEAASTAGFHRHFSKPVDPDTLLRFIADALDR